MKHGVRTQDLKNMDSRELVQYTFHVLNQKSAVLLSYLDALTSERGYGFVNEGQKEMLMGFRHHLEEIRELSNDLNTWLEIHKNE